jgi:hypothetical protein
MAGPSGRYGHRRRPEFAEDGRDQTQPIPRVADSRETRIFARPGDTSVMPKTGKDNVDKFVAEIDTRTAERQKQTYRPGIVMRWFGHALSALLALLCLGVISITIAFVLVKYYGHLFH